MCGIWVLSIHWRVFGRQGKNTVYARYEKKKEKFQTIGETYAKVPWSGKDRACKTLGECTLDQNMGGEKGSSQSLSSAGQGSGKAELMD